MKKESIRKIDELGRIVLPSEMRSILGWHSQSKIAITLEGNSVILKGFQDSCFACGSDNEITPIHNKFICKTCIDSLSLR